MMKIPYPHPIGARIAILVALAAAWFTATTLLRQAAPQAAPATAATPALRHGFINNLDVARYKPDERGTVTITFKQPLPALPTILLQCANPRYTAKVHGASKTGFVFALYRTLDCLRGGNENPFDGSAAAKPVIDFKEAHNIDIAWVAIAGEGN